MMDETNGFEKPNYTQTPNRLFDELLPMIAEAELRVTLAICRKTFGWHKERDQISLTQLEALTGMSRQGVINGIQAGMERGTISRTPTYEGGFFYSVVIAEMPKETSQPSGLPSQLSRLPSQLSGLAEPLASPLSGLEVVNEVDTQKKLKERGTKEKKIPAPSADPSKAHPIKELLGDCEGIWGYVTPKGPKEAQAAKWLLGNYSREDILGCLRFMATDDWWFDKHISLQAVRDRIGPWIKAGRPPDVNDGGRHGTRANGTRADGTGCGNGTSQRVLDTDPGAAERRQYLAGLAAETAERNNPDDLQRMREASARLAREQRERGLL